MEKVGKRNSTLDFFRGLACIFVVFIHIQFPAPFGKWVECVAKFAVPFFFMASGFFAECESQNVCAERIRKGIKNIIKLCAIYVVIYFTNDFVRCVWGNGETNLAPLDYLKNFVSFSSLLKFLLFNIVPVTMPMGWYLFAVLYDYVIFYYINKKNAFHRFYYLMPFLFLGYYLIRLIIPDVFRVLMIDSNYMFARNWLFDGLPNMLLGHCIHRYRNELKKLFNRKICGLYIILFSGAAILINQYLLNMDQELDYYMFNVAVAAMMFILAVISSNMFEESIFTRIGRSYSSIIYIIHGAIISALYTLLNVLGIRQMVLVQWIAPILTVVAAVIFSVIWKNIWLRCLRKRKYK